MFRMMDRPYGRLSIIVALSGAVASGFFVAGVGSAALWFAGTLVALVVCGLLLTRHEAKGPGTGTPTGQSLRRNWKNTVLLLAICSTVALAWLALKRQPLPGLDLGASALVTVLFSLVTMGLVLFFLRLPLLSFPSLFLGVMFLFTSSSFILYPFEGMDAFRGWVLVDVDSMLTAMPLVMLAFASFMVGALLAETGISARRFRTRGHVVHTHSGMLRKVGFALFFFSMFVVAFYSLRGSALNLTYQTGYHGFAGVRREVPTLARVSLTRFLPWSVLILAATSKNQSTRRQTLLLAIPACAILLLMGDRVRLFAVILLVASGSYLMGFSMDWKRSLIVIALVAFLVPVLGSLRVIPVKEWSSDVLVQAMTNQIETRHVSGRSSLIATGLGNLGTSYQTLMGTVMLVPDSEPYRYGVDYIRSLAVAIPFSHPLFSAFGIDLAEGQPDRWMMTSLPRADHGLGYLQVAEAYLQFGTFGVIAQYLALGWILTGLWWSMRTEDLDSRKLALVLIVMVVVLHWIRNDSIGVIRGVTWGYFLVYALPTIVGGLRRVAVRAGDNH